MIRKNKERERGSYYFEKLRERLQQHFKVKVMVRRSIEIAWDIDRKVMVTSLGSVLD